MKNDLIKIRDNILNLVKDYSDLNFKNEKFIPGESEVPVSGKVIGNLELQNMVEASLDGWLTTGRFNEQFQKKLADFLGIKCLLTVNSGSSANLIAFSTLTSAKLKDKAIKKGDEVISVAAGFPTTVNPIIQFGAIPVFIDVKIPTYNIDENLIEEAITPNTKAIMLAHTLGNPFNLKKIREICDKYDLWLIEDSCDALGSKYNNQNVGTFGDLATLSFYPAHHITMGEGGAVFTNSKRLERIAESFRDWGRDCYCEPGKDNTCNKRFGWQLGDLPFGYDHKYTYSHLGYNMKITDMQAACGLAQLESVESFIKKRKQNFNYLFENLKDLENFIILPKAEDNSDPSWFGFPITLKSDNKYNRNDITKFLNEKKIGTRLLFSGNLTKQPSMKNCKFKIHKNLKNTDFIMNNTFWIGLYPGLNTDHLDYMITNIKIFFK
ncbi:lipopolysaccharide biosynthesis protein RfbH [Candidatus Pelagibacter sp.]|jgi:CDP-4-dehydro-6-deoxyglucose reductase, E1|nr:lipopolysaccharide biosynthesis protein RfbH [Candidatus Pelagibacter sp.]